jgi:lipopolysaccharide/colanic/teichoic acid biosynthesis glycosyltransferase
MKDRQQGAAMQWLAAMNPFKRFQSGGNLNGIHTVEEFRMILERERARTDRSGQDFSMVVFGIGSASGSISLANRYLEGAIRKRARNSDAIGWFDTNALAVILYCTSSEGAWKFAESVRQGVSQRIPVLHSSVYTYPTTWIEKNDSGEDEGRDAGSPPSSPGDNVIAFSAHGVDGGKPVQDLKPVFVRSFPYWKDTLDVIAAAILLVILSPLFLVIAILIKVVSPGPVFYTQTRIGYKGRPFKFWKFRTMHVNNDASNHQKYLSTLIAKGDQPMTKLDDGRDPRIIPFGKFLRQSCIDELPQLFNVLLGDMSLVGPRPCLPNEAEEFKLWHTARFDTVPGMTGMWQVNGKNKTTFKQMMRYDIAYARKTTPFTDFKILFMTIPAIIGMVRDQLAAKRAARIDAARLEASQKND